MLRLRGQLDHLLSSLLVVEYSGGAGLRGTDAVPVPVAQHACCQRVIARSCKVERQHCAWDLGLLQGAKVVSGRDWRRCEAVCKRDCLLALRPRVPLLRC